MSGTSAVMVGENRSTFRELASVARDNKNWTRDLESEGSTQSDTCLSNSFAVESAADH